jgi:hypothetical protein
MKICRSCLHEEMRRAFDAIVSPQPEPTEHEMRTGPWRDIQGDVWTLGSTHRRQHRSPVSTSTRNGGHWSWKRPPRRQLWSGAAHRGVWANGPTPVTVTGH